MSFLKQLSNYMDTDSSATAYGTNITPTLTTSYAQNVFASSAGIPNMPKPQSMFKVYFSLHPTVSAQIDYKKQLIEQTTKSEMIANLNQTTDSDRSTYEKTVRDWFDTDISDAATATTVKRKSWVTHSSNQASIADLDAILDMASVKVLAYEMGKMCKAYTLPNITMETKQVNEYNRKRKFYLGSSKYGDLSLTFFDVKENPVQQFLFNYLKFINNDFFMKGNDNWFKTFSKNKWNTEEYADLTDKTTSQVSYDYNPFGFTTESNIQFIQTIVICEYYMDKCMIYTFINPKITSIDFGNGSRDSMNGKDIKVTFSVEGMTNDLTNVTSFTNDLSIRQAAYYRSMVNSPITKDLAAFFQTRYLDKGGVAKQIFNNLINTFVSGEKKFTYNNIMQQVERTAHLMGEARAINGVAKYSANQVDYEKAFSSESWTPIYNTLRDPTTLIGVATGQFGTVFKSLKDNKVSNK